jgi:hypothetical protein
VVSEIVKYICTERVENNSIRLNVEVFQTSVVGSLLYKRLLWFSLDLEFRPGKSV